MTRGRSGSLLLLRVTLSFTAPRRFVPALYGTTLGQGTVSSLAATRVGGRLVVVLLRGGSRRRPGASTTSHSDIRGLRRRPGPSRMTVLRREGALSRTADWGDGTALPHSAVARPSDRAD